MAEDIPGELRGLVAQIVHEVVADVVNKQAAAQMRHDRAPEPQSWGQPSGPADAATRRKVQDVRITGDRDLQAFTHRLLALFENPKTREDLRTGRLRFRLAGEPASPGPSAVEHIETGAVTERRIESAARAGTRVVLGRRAVLTPLAREKARALGVTVEKERR